MNTVKMISPDGEVKEVEADPMVLTPLLVKGWLQVNESKGTKEVKDAGR